MAPFLGHSAEIRDPSARCFIHPDPQGLDALTDDDAAQFVLLVGRVVFGAGPGRIGRLKRLDDSAETAGEGSVRG